jgi:FlaA1/EpsC-like NDP-sugar epimerase
MNIFGWSINPRTVIVALHDVAVAAMAWLGAYWLRFNLDVPAEYLAEAGSTVIWVVPLQAVVFWRFGLYQGIWRFASLPDMKRILKAVGAAALLVPVVIFLFRVQAVVPRSVLVIDPLLLVLFMGGSRLAYRAAKEHRLNALLVSRATPVLIAGAGVAADTLLRDIGRVGGAWRVVGLLDDDPAKVGRQVQGIPVLGPLADLPLWAERMDVQDVVMALPGAQPALRRKLAEHYAEARLRVLTVPSLDDLMDGRVAISQLRKIQLDDLLGRAPVTLDDSGLHDLLAGKQVLVTGAGGSIGAELGRQLSAFKPARLIMLESSELALYQMEQEFRQCFPGQAITCLAGDVKDAARVAQVMSDYRPAIVFHAAAYKHVPLMEKENAFQALRNNTLGTFVVARAAREAGVEKFVMVSTDKAVNPTNVMGASKRLAEMVCQVLRPTANEPLGGRLRGDGGGGTQYVSVRFGNVVGSSGSVIPKFQEQIAQGGPVTVTHPEITRYFMSIPEAAQLVLQAGLMGAGGEIFVLDMGEPVRIADLARLMIKLAGKTEEEVQITFSGLRPGEKLYEELLADSETTLPTPHPKLRVAQAQEVDSGQLRAILDWIGSAPSASDDEVRSKLKEWLPEYNPMPPG